MTRLAVLGSPIGHSQSPALHRAAYRVLGLDWSYEAVDAIGRDLPEILDQDWHGLSLTMPLKRDVLPMLDSVDDVAALTGGANTVLMSSRRGFNTDVHGIVRAFQNAGVEHLETVHILGAGATAASVIVAVRELGAVSALVSARNPANAAPLVALGERVGVDVVARQLGVMDRSLIAASAVINTLPGGTEHFMQFAEAQREAALFEVAYDPWPTQLVESWRGTVIDGLDMLIEQALVQVRIFVGGDPGLELPDEATVLGAMRDAVSR